VLLSLSYFSFTRAHSDSVLELPALSFGDTPRLEENLNSPQAIEAALEYMVWPREREKLLRQYLALNQVQLLQQPLDTASWFRLTRAQRDLGCSSQEIVWSFMHALDQRDWDERSHQSLIFYCTVLHRQLNKEMVSRCDDLLRVTKFRTRQESLAKRIGLSQELVKWRFNLARANQGSL